MFYRMKSEKRVVYIQERVREKVPGSVQEVTMPDNKPGDMNSEKKEFIREKMLEPKKGKWYYIRLVCLLAGSLLLFGAATGISFALVLRHMGVDIYSTEEESMSVTLGKDWIKEEGEETGELPQETSSEETPTEEEDTQSLPETAEKSFGDQMAEVLESMGGDSSIAEYVNASVYSVYESVRNALVTVRVKKTSTEVSSTMQPEETTFGVIVAMSDYEAVVLADYAALKSTENISVSIGEYEMEAVFKEQDDLTGLVSLTVNLRQLPDTVRQNLHAIALGNSYNVKLGDRVLLAGSPLGITNSLLSANITYIDKEVGITDGSCRVLYTDAAAVSGGSGILLNLNGEMVGWITSWSRSGSLSQFTSAVGISELKYVIEDLILGENTALFGVRVHHVTEAMAEEFNLPEGLYVTGVDNQTPAYLAGIQNGDIITAINGTELRTVRGLQNLIYDLTPEEKVTVKVMRLGRDSYKEVEFTIELGNR